MINQFRVGVMKEVIFDSLGRKDSIDSIESNYSMKLMVITSSLAIVSGKKVSQ